MMAEASKTSQKPKLDDLQKIVYELQEQFKTSGSNYFLPQSKDPSTTQIDTTANKATNPFEVQIDQEKAGSHM